MLSLKAQLPSWLPNESINPTMRRILITRPRKEATEFARLARQAGFEPVIFPTIDTRPVDDTTALDRAFAKLDCYDWLVFTSAKAVEYAIASENTPAIVQINGTNDGSRSGAQLNEAASSTGCEEVSSGVRTSFQNAPRIAAIGAKTAAALRARGVEPNLVPEAYTAEALVVSLGDLRGRWVLIPSADIGREALPKAVVGAGGVAHVVTVYHTLPTEPGPQGLGALRAGVDWLTFTSPSTARNFIALVEQAGLSPFRLPGAPRVACIGPVTADAARGMGFHVDAVANPHTVEGLLAAIQAHSESHTAETKSYG